MKALKKLLAVLLGTAVPQIRITVTNLQVQVQALTRQLPMKKPMTKINQ